jgi:hypothetical protein
MCVCVRGKGGGEMNPKMATLSRDNNDNTDKKRQHHHEEARI